MENNNKWVVCFGGEDWWYHSHGHFDIQVMRHFSEKISVLYICSIGMRMPSIRKDKLFWTRINNKLKSIRHSLKQESPRLYIFSPLPFPFYQNSFTRFLNKIILQIQLKIIYKRLDIKKPLYWVNTPTALQLFESFPRSGLVYQRTDDYAAYDFENFNSEYIKLIDRKLIKRANLVIHVSDELHKEALKLSDASIIVSQGVDESFFIRPETIPEELLNIQKPIIGYVGGMGQYKFDTNLIENVVKNKPDCSFVLVGDLNPNVERLKQFSNVHFLGLKKHSEIPAYVHNFDICILPTALTDWGLKCRPLKLMEYIAAQKKVIATPTPASLKYADSIYISENAQTWIEFIDAIISGEAKEGNLLKNRSSNLIPWSLLSQQLWKQINSLKII